MRLLLDTHVFLWFLSDDRGLPEGFRAAIESPTNEVFLSAASLWESLIKHQSGKLPLPESPAMLFPRECVGNAIESLPIDEQTMPFLADLPPLHRDPFDRVMIAQAKQHDLTLVTVDRVVLSYGVATLPLT